MKKSRTEMNIHDREKYDQNVIRQLLKEGDKHSKEILDVLNISSSVFKTRIDSMLNDGEVECYENPDNRRERLYRLKNKSKAFTEEKRYFASKFLDSLKNPLSFEINVPKGKFLAYLSVFAEAKGFDPEKERRNLEDMALQTKAGLDHAHVNFWRPELFGKVVLFLAVEEKGGEKHNE